MVFILLDSFFYFISDSRSVCLHQISRSHVISLVKPSLNSDKELNQPLKRMIESVQLLHQLTNQHSLRVIHERSIKPSVDENGEEYEQANLDQPAASEKIDYSLETPTNRLIGDDYVVEDGSNLEMTSLLDVPVIEDATIDDDEDDTEGIF